MFKNLRIPVTLCLIAMFVFAVASACGSDEESVEMEMAPAPAAPAPAAMVVEAEKTVEVIKEVQVPGETVVVEREVVKAVAQQAAPAAAARARSTASAASADLTAGDGSDRQPAQLAAQRRIIIRTVNMSIVVDDIQSTMDEIAKLADRSGGWVVSTDRREKHTGRISIRIPAVDLESSIEALRGIAKDVESEISTSEDVTDEYYDLQSRLKNQLATEAALIRLLDRAENVEHALAVQRELTTVQENVERIQGRIKLLEETSAYSLVTVNLSLAPVDMTVDAGPDKSVAVHAPVRFKATFRPPEGVDRHEVTWDFGDGDPVTISRTAPTANEGERVTATVTHQFHDPTDSPFIVQVKIRSFGEGGIAEGEDSVTVTVSEIPVIEVFAVSEYMVTENEEVEFFGSFTRPQGLTNVRYRWEFGDGSPSVEGPVDEGVTELAATHAYSNYRPQEYRARLTVTADSVVGEVAASQDIYVQVQEDIGLIVGGFRIGDTFKSAVRTLSVVVSALTDIVIWLAIFSVFWIPLLILAVFLVRRSRRNRDDQPRQEHIRPEPQIQSDE